MIKFPDDCEFHIIARSDCRFGVQRNDGVWIKIFPLGTTFFDCECWLRDFLLGSFPAELSLF